ncbi:MAG: cob(I)yrinic acid a,c-diamide adenosyltransferase [bacterium]
MKIYTKTGDRGVTGLLGPLRVPKSHPRIAAYGEIDELNAVIGVVRAEFARSPIWPDTEPAGAKARGPRRHSFATALDELLARIQSDLFVVGAQLATQPGVRASVAPIGRAHITRLERVIDATTASLAPLSSFILPGGTPLGAHFHLARTVCRRAERAIVALAADEPVAPNVIVYVNRLSDLLFVLARGANAAAGVADIPWSPAMRR